MFKKKQSWRKRPVHNGNRKRERGLEQLEEGDSDTVLEEDHAVEGIAEDRIVLNTEEDATGEFNFVGDLFIDTMVPFLEEQSVIYSGRYSGSCNESCFDFEDRVEDSIETFKTQSKTQWTSFKHGVINKWKS